MPDRIVLADTGPIVAFLVQQEPGHTWAVRQFQRLSAPLITCESVLAESFHFLRKQRGGAERFFRLLETGALSVQFQLSDHLERVGALVRKYESVPMSLADACLVRMSELHPDSQVLTLDGDFRIYRRLGRQVVPTIMPD
ncbi:PIN domain-containing protein [soil metagenome]